MQAEAIGEACSQLAVKPPASYSGLRPGAAVYHAVVATAQQPELAIPETPSLKVSAAAMLCCAGHELRMLRSAYCGMQQCLAFCAPVL